MNMSKKSEAHVARWLPLASLFVLMTIAVGLIVASERQENVPDNRPASVDTAQMGIPQGTSGANPSIIAFPAQPPILGRPAEAPGGLGLQTRYEEPVDPASPVPMVQPAAAPQFQSLPPQNGLDTHFEMVDDKQPLDDASGDSLPELPVRFDSFELMDDTAAVEDASYTADPGPASGTDSFEMDDPQDEPLSYPSQFNTGSHIAQLPQGEQPALPLAPGDLQESPSLNETPSNPAPAVDSSMVPMPSEPSYDPMISESEQLFAQPQIPFQLEPESEFQQTYVPANPEICHDPGCGGDCCVSCPRTWYLNADLVYFRRESKDGLTLAQEDFEGLDGFDWEPGGRITVGRIRDSLDGWELSVFYPRAWESTAVKEGDGNLVPIFTSCGVVDISAFENADLYIQNYQTDFLSVELNRRWWGWDVISTLIGVRYMRFKDEYRMYSRARDLPHNPDVIEEGLLRIEDDNQLLGVQIGMDLYYPLWRFRSTIRSKIGVYGNIYDQDFELDNAGIREIDSHANDLIGSIEGELGWYLGYRVTPRITLYAGYELWWLYGIAEATNQLPNHPAETPLPGQPPGLSCQLDRTTGSGQAETDDDVFFHGAVFGAEVVW